MTGFSDLISQHLYRFLPQSVRDSVMKAEQRGMSVLPQNEVEIYCFSKESHEIFPDSVLESNESVSQLSLPDYSLICTIKDEEEVILAFLDSIVRQQHLPTEIIICDGGSTDRTIDKVNGWIKVNAGRRLESIDVQLIEQKGVGIAAGRNIAVSKAKQELLAFADAGTTLDKQWSQRLLTPFARKPVTEVSMGWYKPVVRGRLERSLSRFLLPRLKGIHPETFLPSARSLALRKQIFLDVGGYPEHLTFAGEDTLFDIYIKCAAQHFAFVPDAICFWRFPEWPIEAFKAIRMYAKGDGESGQLWGYYVLLIERLSKLFIELGIVLIGFLLYFLTSFVGFLVLGVVSFIFYLIKGWRLYTDYRAPLIFEKTSIGRLDFLFDALALKLMLPAQTLGFLNGAKAWPKVESRRILAASKGHLMLLLPEVHFYKPQSETTQRILELLDEGWYLTVVYAQSVIQSDRHRTAFRHAQLENHLRSQFYLNAWMQKHRPFIEEAGREFAYLDLCDDGLSKELVRKLEVEGAKAYVRGEA